MAAKRQPGMDELEQFVEFMGANGVDVADAKTLYRLGAKLLTKAYDIYQVQYARAPRSDKGAAKTAAPDKAPAAKK